MMADVVPFSGNLTTGPTSNLLKTFTAKFLADDLFVDMINVCLYPATFGAVVVGANNSTVEYIRSYLFDMVKTVKILKLNNSTAILNSVRLVETLLTIRESGSSILGYQNVFQHIPVQDLHSQQLITRAIENRLESIDHFRKKMDYILSMIGMYYEVSHIRASLTMIGNFQEYASNSDVSIFETIKNWKDLIINSYTDLSKLQSVNKAESSSDYFVISDKNSSDVLATTLFTYVSRDYSFFRTGFDLFDQHVEGFESSSVHLISAPSNHGKSIFMINLCHMMARINANDFSPTDAIVFITLEDDIYKLSRRFMSIFGNHKYSLLRMAFKQGYEISKANEIVDSKSSMGVKVKSMFKNLIDSSITVLTNGKFGIVVKHANENTFSPGDLGKFIDRLRVEGWNTKMVFLDYVDCAQPTIQRYTHVKDYDVQGQIVQELRNLSREHKVPIITATQNAKVSENVNIAMDNTVIGDSYKKVRFADFLYMCRMRRDLNPLAEPVLSQVTDKNLHFNEQGALNSNIAKMSNLITSSLIPFEVKTTKSKESGKDVSKFSLFCVENLRIYDSIQEFLDDAKVLYPNSKRLEADIKALTDMAITSITEEFDQIPAKELVLSDEEEGSQTLEQLPDFLLS
jgi:hypothetical protein